MAKLLKADKNKAIALIESGFTLTKVASMFGVNRKTIAIIKNDYYKEKEQYEPLEVEALPLNDDLLAKSDDIARIKRELGSSCHNILSSIASGMTPDKVNSSNLRDLAVSFGIMTDKLCIFKEISQGSVDIKHTLVGSIRKSTNE